MAVYTCHMHPEVRSDQPGKCPKCRGCELVLAADDAASAGGSGPEPRLMAHDAHRAPGADPAAVDKPRFAPFFTILGLILLAALASTAAGGPLDWHRVMTAFMAGFFLVFAGFKLIDLPGFAQGYSTYDLLARRVPAYGYVYPFLELALGLAYLTGFAPQFANWATLLLMAFSSLGVLQTLRERRKVLCACLGTAIRLPLTTVTLSEDLGMAAMALAGLVAAGA